MIKQFLQWRSGLGILAILIIIGSGWYAKHLSETLAQEEKGKVQIWVAAQKTILTSSDPQTLALALSISQSNTDIPIIETDEKDRLTGNFQNLDSQKVKSDSLYLSRQLQAFKRVHAPIVLRLQTRPLLENRYYYGESILQRQLRFFPLVELCVVALFLILMFLVQRSHYRSAQNSLWIGMAKETAHQLGTPITSLEGWCELLKEQPASSTIAVEMQKDVSRLRLISDRFSKIGSPPKLERQDIMGPLRQMAAYMQKRAAGKITISVVADTQPVYAYISAPLFDWVSENLLKNALDAMNGKGTIRIHVHLKGRELLIDFSDTGKGMSAATQSKIFDPGFTTKKRGWGLGLVLTKRIVEEYHKGHIFILQSDLGKGTTFRVQLPSGDNAVG